MTALAVLDSARAESERAGQAFVELLNEDLDRLPTSVQQEELLRGLGFFFCGPVAWARFDGLINPRPWSQGKHLFKAFRLASRWEVR